MKDLLNMLANTDPGILTFGAVVFLPGFIIAGAVVYFVIRGIVRSMMAPSRLRKANREKELERRKWDDFYHALDKCTVDNVSYLPADAALINEALGYYSSKHRRELSKREKFICYKRLEQLGVHRTADLAWLYTEHFSETDRNKKAALKHTGILADDGYPEWMMAHANLLLNYNKDEQSTNKAMSLYRKLCETDGDPYIPLLVNDKQGPEAAWRLGKHYYDTYTDMDQLSEGYRLIFLAALHDHSRAMQFLKDEHDGYDQDKDMPLKRVFQGFIGQMYDLFSEDSSDQTLFRYAMAGARYGFPTSYDTASLHYPDAAGEAHCDRYREFCLNRIGAYLESNQCLLRAGLIACSGLPGIPYDRDQGERWLRKAANADSRDAMTTLGILLSTDGRCTEAMEWFEKAIRKGSPEAAEMLAKIYTDGTDIIAPDPKKAEFYTALAEELQKKREQN